MVGARQKPNSRANTEHWRAEHGRNMALPSGVRVFVFVFVVAELAKSFVNAANTESLGAFRYVFYHNFKVEEALVLCPDLILG